MEAHINFWRFFSE
jgi:hypothetical protein